jgi:hypothetical protein
MDTFLSPVPPMRGGSSQASQNPMVGFICLLEGFKSKIKNLHWATTEGMPEHEEYDSLYKDIHDFEDDIQEQSMGMYGQIRPDVIHPIESDSIDSISLVDSILSSVYSFYQNNLVEGIAVAGLRSSFDQFIGQMNKRKYRFNICKK